MFKSVFLQILFAIGFLLPAVAQTSKGVNIDTARIGENEMAGHYANVRGFQMYYETYGEGEPLLLIHGNGGSIVHMVHQIPYFAQHYKVIIADSRAQGKSVDPGDSLSYEMMADDLNALLEELHHDSCHVIGWSDGGINGLLLAMRHPDKVKNLAITGANLWPDTSAVDSWVYRSVSAYNDTLLMLPPSPEIKHQLKLLHLLLFEPNIHLTDLQKIRCPALVIGGDHDVIRPIHTMLIAESIPRSYLWILPNSGHSTPITYKEEFNKVVYEFFQKPYRRIEGVGKFN